MKINKIICDVCNKEINVEVDEGLGVFDYIQAKAKLYFASDTPNDNLKTDKEIVKTSFDLCDRCASNLANHIKNEKVKQTNKNK